MWGFFALLLALVGANAGLVSVAKRRIPRQVAARGGQVVEVRRDYRWFDWHGVYRYWVYWRDPAGTQRITHCRLTLFGLRWDDEPAGPP